MSTRRLHVSRAEAGHRKGDRVDARQKIDDFVLALIAGDRRPDLSIRTGLLASTVTPGNTALDESFTTPAMAPVPCARADPEPMNRDMAAARITLPISAAGTSVTIDDVAPTGDRYNLSICEILVKP